MLLNWSIQHLWRTPAASYEDADHARNTAIMQDNKIQLHTSFVPPTRPAVVGHMPVMHTVLLQTAEHCLSDSNKSKPKPLLASASDQISQQQDRIA